MGNRGVCQSLLAAGAELMLMDNQDRTPLHYAACNNDPELIKLLLEYSLKKPYELYNLYNKNIKKPKQVKGISDLFSLANRPTLLAAPEPEPVPTSIGSKFGGGSSSQAK
jgi:ankyrin repeat protein